MSALKNRTKETAKKLMIVFALSAGAETLYDMSNHATESPENEGFLVNMCQHPQIAIKGAYKHVTAAMLGNNVDTSGINVFEPFICK
jgi:hypothetical protein